MVLAECRRNIEETTAELERLHFQEHRDAGQLAERDRLLALATDFAAQARHLSGAALRELLWPWLCSAVVDKRKRTLVLEIRRIPASGVGIGLSNGPGPD